MEHWSHGYDVSMGYTYGFGREMAPVWLDFISGIAGFSPPQKFHSCDYRYLDLGSGQGVGLCLLAAANPDAQFVGVDFLPEHINHSENLASDAGLANVRFSQADFAELAVDWPDEFGAFDYVALHGVYSWISTQLREAVVRCLDHATRPGSLVYIGYNSQPGWLSSEPFQHITRLLKDVSGKSAPNVFADSLSLFDDLRRNNATIFQMLPQLATEVDRARTKDMSYLAHEFLHEHWHPLWHSQVAQEVRKAGLSNVGTATMAETLLPDLLSPSVREILAACASSDLRQDLIDLTINQRFRRDVFQRDGLESRRDDPNIGAGTPIHLIAPPDLGTPLVMTTTWGDVNLLPQAFADIVTALEPGPLTYGQLASLPGLATRGPEVAAQIIRLLLHSGRLAVGTSRPANPDAAHRLNAVIARRASKGAPYDHIASPAMGSAIAVSNVNLMLLDCWLERSGVIEVEDLRKGVASRLETLGRTLRTDGKAITGRDADHRLTELANRFLDILLPRWRKLGAVA